MSHFQKSKIPKIMNIYGNDKEYRESSSNMYTSYLFFHFYFKGILSMIKFMLSSNEGILKSLFNWYRLSSFLIKPGFKIQGIIFINKIYAEFSFEKILTNPYKIPSQDNNELLNLYLYIYIKAFFYLVSLEL